MYKFSLNETETILRKDMASMSVGKNEAYNGALYLTNERLIFVGYVMDIRNKYIEEILFPQIEDLQAAKSLFIVPNAIALTTKTGRKLRLVVKDRDAWMADIRRKMNEFA